MSDLDLGLSFIWKCHDKAEMRNAGARLFSLVILVGLKPILHVL